MQLSEITTRLLASLSELFKVEHSPDIDWHPATDREENCYQSSICDRLAWQLKISPASIAAGLQSSLNEKYGIEISLDNRGYLYLESKQIVNDEQTKRPDLTLIYIQPPAKDRWTPYYCKFISLIGIQLELLRLEGMKARLYIPSGSLGDQKEALLDAQEFYGRQGFIHLLKFIKEREHNAKSEDLGNFKTFGPSHAQSAVIWMTTDLLSVPHISSVISELEQHWFLKGSLNIKTTQLESDVVESIESSYFNSVDSDGLGTLFYLSELQHPLDLDWETPKLKNWLNLKWLSDSLALRLAIPASEIKANPVDLQADIEKMHFFAGNIAQIQQRAAYFGESQQFSQALRKVLTTWHQILNRGQAEKLFPLNIPASFPQKISSIIEGF